jgi:hypothetical protein
MPNLADIFGHCEREPTQSPSSNGATPEGDCVAALAMTTVMAALDSGIGRA